MGMDEQIFFLSFSLYLFLVTSLNSEMNPAGGKNLNRFQKKWHLGAKYFLKISERLCSVLWISSYLYFISSHSITSKLQSWRSVSVIRGTSGGSLRYASGIWKWIIQRYFIPQSCATQTVWGIFSGSVKQCSTTDLELQWFIPTEGLKFSWLRHPQHCLSTLAHKHERRHSCM